MLIEEGEEDGVETEEKSDQSSAMKELLVFENENNRYHHKHNHSEVV